MSSSPARPSTEPAQPADPFAGIEAMLTPDSGAEASPTPRSAGLAARAIIRAFESCARARPDGLFGAYPDPGTGGAPWTIGWGSTGPDIAQGLIWTQTQCDARLRADLALLAQRLAAVLGAAPTTQNQFDALVCFAYNLGLGALRGSTLMREHLAGDYTAAAAQFARWNKAGERAMPGLTRRRAAEAKLYATPDGAPLPTFQ